MSKFLTLVSIYPGAFEVDCISVLRFQVGMVVAQLVGHENFGLDSVVDDGMHSNGFGFHACPFGGFR